VCSGEGGKREGRKYSLLATSFLMGSLSIGYSLHVLQPKQCAYIICHACYMTRTSHPPGLITISYVLQIGRPRFDPGQKQKFPIALLPAEAHPASYPMGTGGPLLGVKRGRGVTLTTHPI